VDINQADEEQDYDEVCKHFRRIFMQTKQIKSPEGVGCVKERRFYLFVHFLFVGWFEVSLNQFIYSYIYSFFFIHKFIYLFIQLGIHSFSHLFIFPFIH